MAFGKGKYSAEKLEAIRRAAGLRPDEPFFLIRGKDVLAPEAVEAYGHQLEAVSKALMEHGGADDLTTNFHNGSIDCLELADAMRDWQAGQPAGVVRLPD